MCDSEPFDDLEESAAQSFPVVYIVEFRETEKRTLELPSAWTWEPSSIQ